MKYNLGICCLWLLSKELVPVSEVYSRNQTQSRFSSLFESIHQVSQEKSLQRNSSHNFGPFFTINDLSPSTTHSRRKALSEGFKSDSKWSDDPTTIVISKILSGEDKRKSIMIKNIPTKFKASYFHSILEDKFRGMYDLFILPKTKEEKKNHGYAFINFNDTSHIVDFYKQFHGKKWLNTRSDKVCEIVYSKNQGYKKLAKFDLIHTKKCSNANEQPQKNNNNSATQVCYV